MTAFAEIFSPNAVDERTAMGLPQHFVDRTPPTVGRLLAEVVRFNAHDLAAIVQDAGVAFDQRYAAGMALGILGDPRISVFDPAMVDVPAARVRLGIDEDQANAIACSWQEVGVLPGWILKECPAYYADIQRFRIMRYPVTNLEYRQFLIETQFLELPTSWTLGVYPAVASNQPVWTVSAHAAESYAAWLSQRTGRRFRLPRECEWEYAAAGPTGSQYPWGNLFEPDTCNTVESGPLCATPVGIYPKGRTAFGALDMAGNVEEYTADAYSPYPGGKHVADDLYQQNPEYRIARGGSFTRYADLARCTRRHGWYPKDIYAMGFRLLEEIA